MTPRPGTPGVVVVGAGGWGKNHVRNFHGLGALKGICDRDEALLASHAETYPGVKASSDLRTFLDDDDIGAAVVATDAPSHASVALELLRAGKDVLVEKPLSLGSEDASALVQMARAKGRMLMVGHLLLYHPAVIRLKGLIDSGELGEVLYVVCRRLNLGVVRRDENAWWSLAPHDISVANFLLDAEPVAVAAHGGVFLQEGIEDVVFGTLRYPSGRVAHVHVSWLDPHKTRMLTVVGSKKMAVFDDTSPDQKLTIYDKGVEPPPASLRYEEGVRVRTGDIVVPAVRMAEPLRRECEAFLDACRSRVAPLADGVSGLGVVRALEAGARSLREGGREIECATSEGAS